MQLDIPLAARLAGAQLVEASQLPDMLQDTGCYDILLSLGQALIHQIPHRLASDIPGCPEDEQRHDYSDYGVQNIPVRYLYHYQTCEDPQRGIDVGGEMPGIGFQRH